MDAIYLNDSALPAQGNPPAGPARQGPAEARDGMPVPAGWLRFETGCLSVDQVLRNLETAVSLLQTIEGGLAGIGTLMSEVIGTIHGGWRDGDRAGPVPPDYGNFLARRLEQLDEMARACKFHGRGLIDGRSGVVGMGAGVDFVRGGPRTLSSPPEGYEVRIQAFPSRAAITGGVTVHEDWLRSEQEVFLAEGERFLRFDTAKSHSVPEFIRRLQRAVRVAGLDLEVGLTRQRRLIVRHNQYGSHVKFKGFSRLTPLLSKRPGRMEWSRKGRDIQGTLHGQPAFGVGRMLVGFQDNPDTSELAVIWRGARIEEGHWPRCFVAQNGIGFQNGTEPEGKQGMICLPSFYPSALGNWLDTRSEYRSLADCGADTWQKLADSLQLFFAVSCEVDEWREQVREWTKEYQNLALEYLRREVPAQPAPAKTGTALRQVEDMAQAMRRIIRTRANAAG